MSDLKARLTGVALLLASGGGTLVHRHIYEATRNGPAQPAEFALSLLTFFLASTGILLLIHGAKLFEGKLDLPAARSSSPKMDGSDPVVPPASAHDASATRQDAVPSGSRKGGKRETEAEAAVTLRD